MNAPTQKRIREHLATWSAMFGKKPKRGEQEFDTRQPKPGETPTAAEPPETRSAKR